MSRLETVLRHAATAPGNRDRFLDAGLIAPSGELTPHWRERFAELRPLDKAEVRQSPGQFLADASDIVYRGTTSGTSGQFFTYFAGDAWNRARLNARHRSLAWWNIDDTTPILNLASRLQPIRPIDVTLAGKVDAAFLQQLQDLLNVRPVVLRGYPSRLTEVAAKLQPLAEPLPKILGVILTGENHFDFQKTLLQEVFRAPILNEYGCQETGISGMSCPEVGRLHLDDDRCLYEILDGQLVTTDLYNTTMPLVRYRCGDAVELYAEPCPCGRPGLTGRVRGRVENRIKLKSGTVLAGDVELPAFAGIQDYRLVRRSQHLDVILHALAPTYTDRHLQPLHHWLRSQFGPVNIEYFQPQPPTTAKSSGKPWDDDTWAQHLLTGNWGHLRERPHPRGKLALAAQVFDDLINPAVVTGKGIAEVTRQRLHQLYEMYLETGDRTLAHILQLAETRSGEAFPDAADETSRLIQGLYRDRQYLDRLPHIREFPLTGFRVHHLLYALENATATARQQQSPFSQRLNPLLTVFLADLQFFAPRFHPAILASWGEWVWGREFETVSPADEFIEAWCHLRCQLCRQIAFKDPASQLHLKNALHTLERAAQTPADRAKAILERGYSQLVCQASLDPQTWLDIALAESSHLSPHLPPGEFDPLPWSPILRQLAPHFVQLGNPDLAYQCLLASTPPASRVSVFETLARQTNGKQAIVRELNQPGVE